MGFFYCGTIDTTFYDTKDFINSTKSQKSSIKMANGEYMNFKGANTINIASQLHLNSCLFVLSLSHKLLSFSQLTKELNRSTMLLSYNSCI